MLHSKIYSDFKEGVHIYMNSIPPMSPIQNTGLPYMSLSNQINRGDNTSMYEGILHKLYYNVNTLFNLL